MLMKVLVCGAGIQGSYFAGHLHDRGMDVSLLVREARIDNYRRNGVRYAVHPSDEIQTHHVNVVPDTSTIEGYDLYVVCMQKQQAKAFSETLGSLIGSGTALFLGNNGTGNRDYEKHIDAGQILLGFFGVSGYRETDYIRLGVADVPQVWIGALAEEAQPRLDTTTAFLKQSGFNVIQPRSIDGWLKCHLALILPLAGAVYGAGTNTSRLARTPALLKLMVRSLKETIRVMRRLKIRIEPRKFGALSRMPSWYLRRLFEKMMAARESQIGLGGHAGAARKEMQGLAGEFQELVTISELPTPAYDRIMEYLHDELTVEEGFDGDLLR
jgi:2-dehydropantoate 2-reductase